MRVKTRFECHSEESAILSGGRRGILHCLENTLSEIPLRRTLDPATDGLTDRNDTLKEVFTQTLTLPHGPKGRPTRATNVCYGTSIYDLRCRVARAKSHF